MSSMTRRACIACPRVFDGALDCPDCGEPGEPLTETPGGPVLEVCRRIGRPPVEDKRRVRSYRASDAEQARIVANAAAAGVTIAAYVRSRCAK